MTEGCNQMLVLYIVLLAAKEVKLNSLTLQNLRSSSLDALLVSVISVV